MKIALLSVILVTGICFVFETAMYALHTPDYVHVRFPVSWASNNEPVENANVIVKYGENSWYTKKIGRTNQFGIFENNVPVEEGITMYFYFYGRKKGSVIDGGPFIVSYEKIHPPWWQFDKWFEKEAMEEAEEITKAITVG